MDSQTLYLAISARLGGIPMLCWELHHEALLELLEQVQTFSPERREFVVRLTTAVPIQDGVLAASLRNKKTVTPCAAP